MSEFKFSLSDTGLSSLIAEGRSLAPSTAATANFESGLASNTKDADLTYTGDDYLVWDRVNAERLRRGLPSLTELGYPRPLDAPPISSNATNYYGPQPDVPSVGGEVFTIKGPPNMTFEQAKAVFDQQAKTGSLVGFKVGETLSASTQAAGGLAAAQSQLAQAGAALPGGLGGSLPGGVNLNSLTASIGTLGQGAGTQVGSSLQGGMAAFNSLTTGAGAAGSSFKQSLAGSGFDPITGRNASLESAYATGGVSGAMGAFSGTLGALSGPLTGAAGQVGSLASTAVGTISGLIKGTPTAGINVADFAKQGPALSGLGSMSTSDVTGALAQASKLIGQGAGTISNSLGAGKFGFDASQLERAGLVKPGTAAAFLAAGENDLTGVLKSPTVWTGKDGVKSLSGLLSNSGLQDKLQQGLMKSGINDLKSVGIPTDKLTPQALSGLATNAAKSVPDTVNWAKNTPGLPADVKAKMDAAATNGAFAVNLTQTKVDAPVLQETKPEPASNTVDSATVDAAAKRVTGDDRVPEVAVSSSNSYPAMEGLYDLARTTAAEFTALEKRINSLNQDYQTITQEQWNQVNGEAVAIRAKIRTNVNQLLEAGKAEHKKFPDTFKRYSKESIAQDAFTRAIISFSSGEVVQLSDRVRELIKDLANKISVRAQSNTYSGAG